MFDFDVGKILVFGIVALAVIPPKDLPRVMRTVGQFIGRMRRMASEFQGQFMDAMKEADIESVKREFTAMNEAAKVDTSFDPAMAMRSEITNSIEPPKSIAPPAVLDEATHVSTEVTVQAPRLPDVELPPVIHAPPETPPPPSNSNHAEAGESAAR